MKTGVRTIQQHIIDAMEAADVAWWELEFPSGALQFSDNKAKMIGYDASDFVHFTHFTSLIHPDDYDDTMQAMKDLYENRKDIYETTYRIKHKDGHYVRFHDKGKIVEKNEHGFVVAGIIRKV